MCHSYVKLYDKMSILKNLQSDLIVLYYVGWQRNVIGPFRPGDNANTFGGRKSRTPQPLQPNSQEGGSIVLDNDKEEDYYYTTPISSQHIHQQLGNSTGTRNNVDEANSRGVGGGNFPSPAILPTTNLINRMQQQMQQHNLR